MSSPLHASFASIAFHASDKLRFFQFPESVHRDGARRVIQASWPDGIQAESAHVGSAAYEYKLHGRPFGHQGSAAGLAGRVLVRNLLAYLYGLGWLLDASLSQARSVGSKDTLIFRKRQQNQNQQQNQQQPRWLAIGLTGGNRLRFLGGCGDGDGEGTMIGSLRRELQRLGLHAGGQATMDQGGVGAPAEPGYEFRLQRPMWRVETGERVLQAQTLTLRIVEVLDSFG